MLGFPPLLPTTKRDLEDRGIDQLDVIIVTGDAYVDHPAFGAALVGRYMESLGLTVGIIAMPDVKDPRAFTKNSMRHAVFSPSPPETSTQCFSLFTAQKKIRGDDPYAPGGMAGKRPQRATIAYCNAIRRDFKDVPIIIGGIEASLRRQPSTTIIGPTPFGNPLSWTPRPTCLFTAWPKNRWNRS